MSDRRLRVGFIGAGWVASARHIPAFQLHPAVDLLAVYDRDLERAAAVGRRFGIPCCHDDLQAFLEEGMDIVSVCTPPWTHSALVLQSLEHGCHVFTEKPMAMSVEEADVMIEAAQQAGTKLCVSHNFLFSRSMLKAEDLIRQGEIGAIQHVLGLQLSNPRRRLPSWYADLPGGLFFDEAPHLLYLMRRFLGGLQVEQASVNVDSSGRGTATHVEARISGETTNGLLSMSFQAPVSEWVLLVVGSRRVMVLDVFRDVLTVMRPDGSHSAPEVLKSSLAFGWGLAKGFLTSGLLYSRKRLLYGHDVLIYRFVDSIIHGGSPPVTGEDGREVVHAMQDILRTAGYTQRRPAAG